MLHLNPSTVAKAYTTLERAAVIVTRRGGGSFVADRPDERLWIDLREDRLNTLLAGAALEALSLGFEPDEVEARFIAQLSRWRQRHAAAGKDLAALPDRAPQLRFVGSHDLAVELLISRLGRIAPQVTLSARYTGSLSGLIALELDEAELAGAHLLDEETGQYNVPFVRRLLPGQDVVAITLVERWQGLLVPRGNPKGIVGFSDLARPDLVFVNRQRGSGTRVLLDSRLRALGIRAGSLSGYEREEQTHVGVAAAVADGSADVGLGIAPAAHAAGLDFLPLLKERYDLIALRSGYESAVLAPVWALLQSPEFRGVVAAMGGYDLALTGEPVLAP